MIGLKENVILGKLIPAGTGMKRYREVILDTDNPVVELLKDDDDIVVFDEDDDETAGDMMQDAEIEEELISITEE